MGSVFTNKAPVPGPAEAMKELGCPKPAENPWPAFHQALELTLGQLLPCSNLLQEMLTAQNTAEEAALCRFDPMVSFPCNKGSPLDKHLWEGLGRNRLDSSAILVLQNGCTPTLMPFLQWLPWDLILASLVTSKGPLIICGFNNLYFQIASIKPFSLVPKSLSNKRPKSDNYFWFHNSTVSILTSMHFYMHKCQFNSIECLKNELQCCDSPDPGFEALKQSENKKPKPSLSARSASPAEQVSCGEGCISLYIIAHLHAHIRSFVRAKFCLYNFPCILPIEQTFGKAA